MKTQIMTLCTAAVLFAACQKQPEQQAQASKPESRVASERLSQPAPNPQTSEDVNPAEWTGLKFKIVKVPQEGHARKIPHTSYEGTLEIIDRHDGTYALKTEDGQTKWPGEYKDVVLEFNKGQEFCTRPPLEPDPKVSSEKQTANFIRDPLARRFVSKVVHKLHESDDQHTDHRIRICLIDPKETNGAKEILISTDKERGGHDGVSHGVS